MSFTAPGECEDKDHIVVGDKIWFAVIVLEKLVGTKVLLEVKEIEIDDDGSKKIAVSNVRDK